MGFTHYFSRKKNFPATKFAEASEDCRKVVAYLAEKLAFSLWNDRDNPKNIPCFNRRGIRFNGVGELGYEAFHVKRVLAPEEWKKSERGYYFDFCKTARKPYDSAVCACLIVLQHHLPDDIQVSSDGEHDEENWPIARDCCQLRLGYGADFTFNQDDNIGRMNRSGMPIQETLQSPQMRRSVVVLVNGWAMTRFKKYRDFSPTFLPDKHRVGVFENDYGAAYGQQESYLFAASSYGQARMMAAARYIKDKFAGQGIDEFLTAFEHSLDWNHLAIATDYLSDIRHDESSRKKLLALLPRGVVPKLCV